MRAFAVGPFERSPAQVGAVLLGLGFILAVLALRALPPVEPPRAFVHVASGPAPGWYGADDPVTALAGAGVQAEGLPLTEGASVDVVDGHAVVADAAAPVGYRATGGRLHLNRATQAELEALPKVGPTLAARIVAGRPYRSVDDLDRVKGIGPATLAKLRPYVEP